MGLTRLRQAPYIAVARAKGVNARGIRWHHAVRVGSIGTVAMLGLMLPTLVGGAVVIETLFAWPGMGRLMVHAVAVRDAPLLAGGLVCTAVAVALGSLITDLVVQLLDPRLRDGAGVR